MPLAGDEPVALEPAERRKKGTRIDLEHAFADLFEPHADAVSMHRFERQRLQNEHVQRALDQAARFVFNPHRTPHLAKLEE